MQQNRDNILQCGWSIGCELLNVAVRQENAAGSPGNRPKTPGPFPSEAHESLIRREMVAEVPLTGLSVWGLA